MPLPHFILRTFSVAFLAMVTSVASAQDYPRKPVRIVTSAPGGAGDFASRQLASGGLIESLGQQVIVDNRGNGSGEVVLKATPDGYTILVEGNSFWIAPLLQKMSYDAMRDFAPITLLTTAPNVLVVHPAVPASSVKELIALAKAKPRALNYSSAGTGSGSHLAAELFKFRTGVDIVHIPFAGGGPSVIGLLGGQVQLSFGTAVATAPFIKSGKLRALGVASLEPTALAPGIPTIAVSGVPGFEASTQIAMFAPIKTPAAIVNRLNQEVARILNKPVVRDRFFNNGAETVGNSSQEFTARLKSDLVMWGKLISETGMKGD